MTQVRIADLLASSPVDPTAHLDPDRVRRYAELLDDLPPVVAFRTAQGLILADGYHRVAAAQARGLDTVEAEIRHGSAHDALRYAATIAAEQRGLRQEEVMRYLRRRSGDRWGHDEPRAAREPDPRPPTS
jgi:ParB-like chromosome segregation protein Spo0J